MRKFLLAIVALLLACTPAFAADANGKWKAEFETPIGTQHYTYEFHVDGSKLTGKAKNDQGETELTEGKVDGDTISFVEGLTFDGNSIRIVYTGKAEGDQIKFSRQVGEYGTESFIATRMK